MNPNLIISSKQTKAFIGEDKKKCMPFFKNHFGFTKEELSVFKKLNTPRKIQDFLNSLTINFEENGETCLSPRMVLRERKAHCMEGAMLAAAALRINGYPPLIVDLEAVKHDDDHVIAVFRKNSFWGAISKTNHSSLRYREPIYRDIRELVLSYFHEYFMNSNGKKTLRRYSDPINLEKFDKKGWMTSEKDVFYIPPYLLRIHHTKILTKSQAAGLRKVDTIELKAGKLVDYRH